jgi:hypothetical protein
VGPKIEVRWWRARLVSEFEVVQAIQSDRRERTGALMIANALGATGSKMIVAVDEADDLFAGLDEENAATRHGSKLFMNRLVERVAGPTIWIVNDIDRLGPAVVRRMNLVMRSPNPSLSVRKRMIDCIADRAEFHLNADETAKLGAFPQPSADRKRGPLRRAYRWTSKLSNADFMPWGRANWRPSRRRWPSTRC